MAESQDSRDSCPGRNDGIKFVEPPCGSNINTTFDGLPALDGPEGVHPSETGIDKAQMNAYPSAQRRNVTISNRQTLNAVLRPTKIPGA